MTKRVNRPHLKSGRKPLGANPHRVEGDVVIMELASGDIVRFDLSDLGLVLPLRWVRTGPANKPCATSRAKGRSDLKMHRLLMGVTDPNVQVDHVNHDTLDNRRCNLRIATGCENTRNRRLPQHNTTGYLGVYRRPSGRWGAQIETSLGGARVCLYLGEHDDQADAAKVRDAAAIRIHGDFAMLNFGRHEIQASHVDIADRVILKRLKNVSLPLPASTGNNTTDERELQATKAPLGSA